VAMSTQNTTSTPTTRFAITRNPANASMGDAIYSRFEPTTRVGPRASRSSGSWAAESCYPCRNPPSNLLGEVALQAALYFTLR
jgi:hypothetical protein